MFFRHTQKLSLKWNDDANVVILVLMVMMMVVVEVRGGALFSVSVC